MHRPAVEFPLFCGDEREVVREFLGNYKRAGLLNGWESSRVVFPFFKKTLKLMVKDLSGSVNLAFEVLSEKTYFSRANQWQLRQKLEVRRQ